MRNLLLALIYLTLFPGCAYLDMAKEARDVAVNTSVREYCKLPESVRLANRDRFRTSPDKPPFIEVHCENL